MTVSRSALIARISYELLREPAQEAALTCTLHLTNGHSVSGTVPLPRAELEELRIDSHALMAAARAKAEAALDERLACTQLTS